MTTQLMDDDDPIKKQFQSQAYQLFEKVGEGGFGYVYRAKQVNTGQIVAIKFIRFSDEFDEIKKQRYAERFERETLICSRLQHPNIVRLLDKGRSDDLLYAVLEYVDGQTLKQRLAQSGALLPAVAAEVMAQVLDALSHAHEQGVVHRDIKPANIMLTKTGAKTHAMVLDFGISTLVSAARQVDFKTITLSQETLGTPSYSAPEQLRGEPPTPKTDIYVWGLVFLECLTGQPTISGSSLASIFHKQLSESNVPFPAALAGHTANPFLRRVLDKKANQRAGNAAELYSEFTSLNFSTLVGDITGEYQRLSSDRRVATAQTGADDTLISDDTLVSDGELLTSQMPASYTSLAERKQISVLCVSLTVKTAASDEADIDYEVIDTLYRDQKAQCIDIAISFGAFHAGAVGDTLLFYFGYPMVSDNDSRLCARTALEVASRLRNRSSLLKQSQGIEVAVHMGMHTGIIMTYADAIPEGHTTNTAMRLARIAEANQIICTDTCKKRLNSYLEFQPRQSKSIGMTHQPVLLYSLIGERQTEAFGFLRVNKNNQQFIGREQELLTLQKVLQDQQFDKEHGNRFGHNANMVHIYGEAGIGKSRLVFELKNKAQGFTHYTAQCFPEHKNNALYPIFNVIKHKFSLDAYSPEEAVAVLRGEVSQLNETDELEVMPILCSWLALPLPSDIPMSVHSPDGQKRILFDVLIALLLKRVSTISSQPGLIMFEDMHWADPTSLAFIARLGADPAFQASKDVFISTSRMPLPVTLSKICFQILGLLKLDIDDSIKFVSNLLDNREVAANLLDAVVTRADGIPLFIEELVNMLLHKAMIKCVNGSFDFVSSDFGEQLPDSLRDSLQQKLDALLYAKETAQLAATIGREFDYELLAATSNQSEAQLQSNLNELIEAQLLFVQRKVGGDSYIFKHALVRDAAYESMPQQRQQYNHQQIGATLESHFRSRAIATPGLLAMHFSLASNFQSAAEFGIHHAKLQVERSQNLEALSAAYTNVQWAEKVTEEQKRVELLLRSYEHLLPALMLTKGYGAQELIETITIIHQLIEQWGTYSKQNSPSDWDELVDTSQRIQFIYYHYRSEREKARNLGNALLAEARAKNDKRKAMVILSHLGQATEADGDFKLALAHYSEAIDLYEQVNDPNVGLESGVHVWAMAMNMRSIVQCYCGYVDEALTSVLEALEFAERIKHDGAIAFSYLYIGFYYSFLGDNAKVIEYSEVYYQKHSKSVEGVWHTIGIDMLYAFAKRDMDASVQALDGLMNSGQNFSTPFLAHLLSNAYIERGEYDKAIKLLRLYLNKAEKDNYYLPLGLIKTNLATCLYQQSGEYTAQIEQYFESALVDVRKQEAIYLELQILCDYQRLAGIEGSQVRKNRIKEIVDNNLVSVGAPAHIKAKTLLGY